MAAILTFGGMPGLPALREQRVAAAKHAELGEERRQPRWPRDAGALRKMQVRRDSGKPKLAHCGRRWNSLLTAPRLDVLGLWDLWLPWEQG